MSAKDLTNSDLPSDRDPKTARANGPAVLDGNVDSLNLSRAAKALDPWHIPPRVTRLDPLAKAAVDRLLDTKGFAEAGKYAQDEVTSHGLGNALSKVTARLRRMGLDDVTSTILSNRTLYSATVGQLLYRMQHGERAVKGAARDFDGIREILADDSGFASSILRSLEDRTGEGGLKLQFLLRLVDEAARARRLNISPDQKLLVAENLSNTGVSLAPGVPVATIENLARKVADEQLPRHWVERYAERKELMRGRLTNAIRKAMVRHLIDLGVNFDDITDNSFKAGQFDEYFAIAYSRSRQTVGEAEGEVSDDYQVRSFDDAISFGLDRDAILGVGMVDYVYEVGEGARVFDLVERLVLDHEAGLLGTLSASNDPSLNGETDLGALLDLEFDQMQGGQHLAPEERAMYYRRALGKGDAEALADSSLNDVFAQLWDALILAAYQYIEKEERVGAETTFTPISRTPIFESARELQRNLTQFGSGMGRRAKSLYARLERAFKILEHPDTADYAGGGRPRTLVKTIERLAHSRLDTTVNASSAFTLAVDGNRIFRFIADFDPGTVSDEAFRELLVSCERYAIARGSRPANTDTESTEEETESDGEDEFADFDA